MPARICSSILKNLLTSTVTQVLSSNTPMPASRPSSARQRSRASIFLQNCQLSTVNCQPRKPSSSRSSTSSLQLSVRQAPITALLESATTATNSPRRSTSSTTTSLSLVNRTKNSSCSVFLLLKPPAKSSASVWAS